MKNIRKFGQIPMGRFGLSGLFKRKNNKTSNFSIRDNESGKDYFERFKIDSGIADSNKKALETITSNTNFDSRLKNLDNKIKAANHMIEGRTPKVNKDDDDDINSMFGDIAQNNLTAIQEEPKLTRRLRFARAFGEAKRQKLKEFEFEDGRYGTLLADEVEPKNLVHIPDKSLANKEEADRIIDSENISSQGPLSSGYVISNILTNSASNTSLPNAINIDNINTNDIYTPGIFLLDSPLTMIRAKNSGSKYYLTRDGKLFDLSTNRIIATNYKMPKSIFKVPTKPTTSGFGIM